MQFTATVWFNIDPKCFFHNSQCHLEKKQNNIFKQNVSKSTLEGNTHGVKRRFESFYKVFLCSKMCN